MGARIPLERLMGSPDVRLRLVAASSLGSIADSRSRIVLEHALRDLDRHVRAQAAFALSRIPHPDSAPLLIDLLAHDENALVRNASAIALGRIGAHQAIPTLERSLSDESDRVRREAVIALERCRDPSVATKVRGLLGDSARRVRIAVTVVLGLRRDTDSAPALIQFSRRADVWEKPALMVALGRIGTPECGMELARSADHPARWVRVCALYGLAEMHAPETRPVARSKLADSAWAVRGAAALALGRAGNVTDSATVAPLLEDPSGWVRRAAIYSLGQLKSRQYAARIRELIASRDPEVQLAAIWSVGQLGDQSALPELVRRLRRAKPHGQASRRTLALGDGAVRLVSDADLRLFDALVQAIGTLANDEPNKLTLDSMLRARKKLSEAELELPARLPTPLGSGTGSITRRQLFDGVVGHH